MEPTSSTRGSKRWWSERFWSVMEAIGIARRLERGKRYARAERVLAVDIAAGAVRAEVQGSRYEPYYVEIGLDVFTDEQWHDAVKALASQALFSAKLLSGEMPEAIEQTFANVGLSLFPTSPSELTMSCSCPDKVVPCKHVAALHYVLAERLDGDPFLLFRWRGRNRERILRELRQMRAAEASGRSLERPSHRSLEDSVEQFWQTGEALESLTVSVGPPAVSASLMKRLGVPAFWKPHPEIRGSLDRLYAKVTERAMALAYSGRSFRGPEKADG